jgi:predicted RNA binding protein YcfA (HicA-like mRNA interferase family)
MPKLPQVSGNDLVKLLKTLGYSVQRQKGSHVMLKRVTLVGEHNITVPKHDVVAKGTLNDVLNKISLWNSIPKEELINRLK